MSMKSLESWFKYFTRFPFPVTSCCLRGSWSTWDKMKAFGLIHYSLINAFILMHTWFVDDWESSLEFGAILNPMGLTGKACCVCGGILVLEYFVLQIIICFNPISLLQLNLGKNQRIMKGTKVFPEILSQNMLDKFSRESEITYSIVSTGTAMISRFYNFVLVYYAISFMVYFSFSFKSIFLGILWSMIIHAINLEIMRDVYMHYWLWFVSIRYLTLCIDDLFVDQSKSMKLHLNDFLQVCQQTRLVNFLSKKLMTVCLVFGVAYHAFLFQMCYFIFQAEETWTPLMLVMIVASTATFVIKVIYLIAAATPLTKSTELRRRVYLLLYRSDNLCWIHKKILLNVIKSQGNENPCSRIALTAIDGQLLDLKLFLKQFIYSARVTIFLFKILRQVSR